MKIKLQQNVNNHSKDIVEIIDKIIEDFCEELRLYYVKTGDKELFQFNEQAFVGLLNNAIVRNDTNKEIITIQEYCVKDRKDRKNGRVDLLMYNSDNKTCILFEAKHYYTNEKKDEKWSAKDTDRDLEKIIEQARSYYKSENDYYSDKEKDFFKGKIVYVCAIVFDSVLKFKTTIEDYLKLKDFDDLENDYYSYTLHEENTQHEEKKSIKDVLNIYGRVKEIQKLEN
jgi:hypothetical protein